MHSVTELSNKTYDQFPRMTFDSSLNDIYCKYIYIFIYIYIGHKFLLSEVYYTKIYLYLSVIRC